MQFDSLPPGATRQRYLTVLRIGRLLEACILPEKRDEAIFEIVNQLNRGSHLVASAGERKRLAELNLIAGRRAKISTAYTSALAYLGAARALLTEENWHEDYELIFSIEYEAAECELLTADMAAAENRLLMLAQRAKRAHDIAVVTRLRVTLYTTLDRSDRAVEVFLHYLQRRGTDWSPHPTSDEVRREYDRVWSLLGSRQIEELVELPMLTNPEVLDVLAVFTEIVTPAVFCDQNLSSLVICRMVNIGLEHGNSDASCFAYVSFALIAGARFGNYKDGFRFGRLGYELVEKRGLRRYQARTYLFFGEIVMPWTQHIQAGRDLVCRAFDVANAMGDLTFATYSCGLLIKNLLTAGDRLEGVQRQAENSLEFARQARFGLMIDIITARTQFIRTLRGMTPTFGCFSDEEFDESRFEQHLAGNRELRVSECIYWTLKVQARFLAGDYSSALAAAFNAQELLWTSPSESEAAEFRLYGALSHAASWDFAGTGQRPQHVEALIAHHRQLEVWAQNCPENFEDRAALVGAEIARIEGRALDAEQLYEQAIRSARANGFVHNEAVANELAARFYAARGFETTSHAYLREARYCYLRWGADGKVKQLDRLHPRLKDESPVPGPTSTIGAPVEHLELETVIKVSQAIAGEIVLEKLLDTLMRIALEEAGAERGLLIIPRGTEIHVQAEATTSGEAVIVRLEEAMAGRAAVPESVLSYVMRTGETVVLDDASTHPLFSADAYIRDKHARSLLCLPLLRQAKVTGVLYLENNLAPRVFTPAQIAVLRMLASQAAMSLENTRLYRDLEQREAKIQRLVDVDIIGIYIWDLDGRILEANDAFLGMIGYDRDDLAAGRIRWRDLTPPEWRERSAEMIREHKMHGRVGPFEKEYFHKDGSRVPVLIGVAAFEEKGNQGAPFVLDLTERKRAEAEREKLEERLRQAEKMQAIGTLAGGIAHDFNNILGAILGYGEMALRGAPKESRLRSDLDNIMIAGERGRALVDRILAFSRSGVSEPIAVRVDQVVGEALDLLAAKLPPGVRIERQLRLGRAAVLGDPTQVHQLLMNLATNAIQAMTSGGTLRVLLQAVRLDAARVATIGALDAGDYVVLEIGDSGVGIAPEMLRRIFDPFFTTKEVGVGTGLGLSLVHGIVTELGGAINVASALGAGSTFTVYLPRAGDAIEVGEMATPAMPRGNHERVLVVDDEEPLVRIATETLEELGYRPVGFTSSLAALEAFRADPLGFDAVISDERMPGMSGSTLIGKVRGIRAGIPTMLMSGFTGGTVSSRAREAGADEVLKKPLTGRELAMSLARVLHA